MFGNSERTILSIYYCPSCRGNYKAQTGNVRISCAVYHVSGCCHYGERQVSQDELTAINKVLGINDEQPKEVTEISIGPGTVTVSG